MTAAGTPSTCATGAYGAKSTDTACKAVLTYLDKMAGETSTYASSFWQSGTDGPYKLTSFDSLGNATFVPNPTYAGPQKSQVAEVKQVAFTAASAEMNALRAGTIDLGYADTTYLSKGAPAPGKVGPNWSAIASNYTITTGSSWGMDYAQYNFNPKNPEAKFLDQLYIRQALQYAVNQMGIIAKIDKGYGLLSYSPLPATAAASIGGPDRPSCTPTTSTHGRSRCPSHGWKKVNGALLCEKPGTGSTDCGKGISKGNRLSDPLRVRLG